MSDVERHAQCSCGALRLRARGEAIRISVCHCHACQRRTGSAFGVQARFARADVVIEGDATVYRRVGDEGSAIDFSFCPACGATVFYVMVDDADVVAVPVGAFADNAFPPPTVQVYAARRHGWVSLPEGIETYD